MLDGISRVAGKVQATAAESNLFPVESWWPGGRGPMLVIQGLADVWAPVENGRSLKADYPNRVTLVELPEVGHFMARERPDLIAEAIVSFVRALLRPLLLPAALRVLRPPSAGGHVCVFCCAPTQASHART
jgi:pimeloyl-ACP methyl ester carboxylesterase